MASKKKKADSSSGSEEDDIKDKPKKAKTSGGSKGDEDKEPSWPLDKKRFLKVREFKGKVMIDLREYYDSDGEMKPGRKGISLSLQQWRKLVEISKEVDEVLKKM
ncbi:RNA polymerase II transcriptional coactivator isoform X2 [Halyomorpha halys]|nr:RNA polymerase II transcriptional coactivator [Halyomorpha halys]